MHTVAVAELPTLETTVLGPGRWQEISQQQIDQFAEATGDHQWIHVDPERAASGPYGRTIAHGYLTLSLVPALLDELLQVHDAAQAINYGLDKARFPAPAPVGVAGSALRGRGEGRTGAIGIPGRPHGHSRLRRRTQAGLRRPGALPLLRPDPAHRRVARMHRSAYGEAVCTTACPPITTLAPRSCLPDVWDPVGVHAAVDNLEMVLGALRQ